jgi:hypothetical protein
VSGRGRTRSFAPSRLTTTRQLRFRGPRRLSRITMAREVGGSSSGSLMPSAGPRSPSHTRIAGVFPEDLDRALGLYFDARNEPRLRVECTMQPTAGCRGQQSIACSEEWRLLQPSAALSACSASCCIEREAAARVGSNSGGPDVTSSSMFLTETGRSRPRPGHARPEPRRVRPAHPSHRQHQPTGAGRASPRLGRSALLAESTPEQYDRGCRPAGGAACPRAPPTCAQGVGGGASKSRRPRAELPRPSPTAPSTSWPRFWEQSDYRP